MEADAQEIWQQVHNGLRAFIAKRVANEAEADDIVQDVWLKMQRGLDGGKRSESADLMDLPDCASCDHRSLPCARSPERNARRSCGDLEAHQSLSSRAAASDDSGRLRTELAGCLRPMIEQLSEDYRQAVTLVDLEGLTQRAAAVQLGLSLSEMKSRVQRGRRQLKRMLEACCTIELDRRRGVTAYDVRDQKCNSC